MQETSSNTNLYFLTGEGEMGERNLRNLLLEAPANICVLRGPLHVYELANKRYLQLVGNRDIAGKPIREALPELEGQGFYEILDNVYKTGETFIGNELPLKLDKGNSMLEEAYINFVYQPLHNSQGKIDGIFVHGVDVTEQVLARKKIEESAVENLKLAAIVNSSEDAIISKTLEGIITSWNPGAEKIFGYTAAEMVGQRITKLIPEDRLNEEPYIIKQISHGKNVDHFETRRLTKSGKLIDISLTISPIKDSKGKIIGASKIARDVTGQIEARKKIEENEKFLELIINSAPSLIFYLDKEIRYRIINDAFKQWFNADRKDVIGKTMEEFLGNKAWQVIKPHLPAAYQGETIEYETEIDYRVGGKKWIHSVYTPHKNEKGEVIGIVVMVNDITQRKLAEQKIQQSEKKFQAAILAVEGIIWTNNGLGEMEGEQSGWANLTGQRYEDYQGFGWAKMIHPGDAQPTIDAWHMAVANKNTFQFEHRVNTKRYGYRLFSVKAVPVFDEKNIIQKWVGVHTDINAQREAEKHIKESEERFRSLAQTLPQLVWVTDAQGISEFASVRWKEYSGIEPGGEKEWKAIVHPDDYDGINAAWMHSVTTGIIYHHDVRLKSKTGEYRWHTVIGEPVFDKENKIVKWVGAFTDIHELKQIEERKDEFIGIASHEMKTPLTTVKGYLQMLELSLDESNEDANLYVKKANQSVSRLNELISELLDVSKIRLGKLDYNITTFNFNDMVHSTVENIQLISPNHTIIKSGKVNDEVTGDKDRLQQVVINLLTNAIKYSPGAEKVFITVEQQNEIIKVAVKDSGIGISKESLKKIFDKYHRIEEHAVHFQGLGIGLFISYEIIQRHHGKLWAESEQGKGSTFHFTLPVNYVEAAQ